MRENHVTELGPARLERLALLGEELGEVQQIIGKIIRHGYESYSPYDPNRTTNRSLLEKELGDVMAAYQILVLNEEVSRNNVVRHQNNKLMRVGKYLHYYHEGVFDEPTGGDGS